MFGLFFRQTTPKYLWWVMKDNVESTYVQLAYTSTLLLSTAFPVAWTTFFLRSLNCCVGANGWHSASTFTRLAFRWSASFQTLLHSHFNSNTVKRASSIRHKKIIHINRAHTKMTMTNGRTKPRPRKIEIRSGENPTRPPPVPGSPSNPPGIVFPRQIGTPPPIVQGTKASRKYTTRSTRESSELKAPARNAWRIKILKLASWKDFRRTYETKFFPTSSTTR